MKQRMKDNVATLQTLYETDFYAWAMKTAGLIRQGRLHEVDWGQVAEELEDMGRSDRREMASHLEKLSAHRMLGFPKSANVLELNPPMKQCHSPQVLRRHGKSFAR